MKYPLRRLIPFILMLSIFLSSCREENNSLKMKKGKYEITNNEELASVYSVLSEFDHTPTYNIASRINLVESSLEEYLSKQNVVNLPFLIDRYNIDTLYQEWGIFRNSATKEDTIFYVKLIPRFGLIKLDEEEIWVIESVECNWQKSDLLSGCDIIPITRLNHLVSDSSEIISSVDLTLQFMVPEGFTTIRGNCSYSSKSRRKIEGWSDRISISRQRKDSHFESLIRNNGDSRESGDFF